MAVISRGLEGIIAAETRIGDVRGDIGQLIYCGYDINDLAGKVTYEEVVHLLWHNRLPTASELEKLTTALRAERELPQGVIDFIVSAPKTAAPIDIMRTAVSMLGCYPTGRHDLEMSDSQAIAIKLVAQKLLHKFNLLVFVSGSFCFHGGSLSIATMLTSFLCFFIRPHIFIYTLL